MDRTPSNLAVLGPWWTGSTQEGTKVLKNRNHVSRNVDATQEDFLPRQCYMDTNWINGWCWAVPPHMRGGAHRKRHAQALRLSDDPTNGTRRFSETRRTWKHHFPGRALAEAAVKAHHGGGGSTQNGEKRHLIVKA